MRGSSPIALQTLWLGALTGAMGVATGFALFIMVWVEPASVPRLLLILAALATFAFTFEYLRDVIDGTQHHFRPAALVVRLVLVAAFELFALALDVVLTSDWRTLGQEIGTAVLGFRLAHEAGAWWNLATMAGLWLLIGAALGVGLASAICGFDGRPRTARDGWKVGAITGAVAAPIMVFLYLVGARLCFEFAWMVSKPDDWVQNLRNLYDWMPGWPKWLLFIPLQVAEKFHASGWGPILAVLALVIIALILSGMMSKGELALGPLLVPVIVLGGPLIGPAIVHDIPTVATMLLLAAVVWGIPGLLLGIAVPYLRRPSEYPKTWAFVAWGVAAGVIVFVTALHGNGWLLLLAAVLGVGGLLFWRGAPVHEYWPFLALSIGIAVLGMTHLTQQARFFQIQQLSQALVSEPLGRVAAPRARWVPDYSSQLSQAVLRDWASRPIGSLGTGVPFGLGSSWLVPPLGVSPSAPTLGDLFGAQASKLHEYLRRIPPLERAVQALESEQPAPTQFIAQSAVNDDLRRTLTALTHRQLTQVLDAQANSANLLAAGGKRMQAISAKTAEVSALRRSLSTLYLFSSENIAVRDDAERRLDGLNQGLAAAGREMTEATEMLSASNGSLQQHLTTLKVKLSEQFEQCLNGALGFWISLGLLAGWSRYTMTPSH